MPSGVTAQTLTTTNLPNHSHSVTISGSSAAGTDDTPGPGLLPIQADRDVYRAGSLVDTETTTTTSTGGQQEFSV
ncbi:MAG: microcystin-dependent protein [Bradymonadia bacterium]